MADLPSVAAHRHRVLEPVAPLPSVAVPPSVGVGRVLAADVPAPWAVPGFDHAAMDGYAVRGADVTGAAADSPVRLPVAGVVAAGAVWPAELTPGSALRIMTGAAVPAGADTVVPFEWTDRGHDNVLIEHPVAAGRHIRRTGEDVAAGAVALAAGTRLAPRHLGLLAAVGCREVVVRPQPRVAVIATGAELVGASYLTESLDAGAAADDSVRYDAPDLPPGTVPDSNSPTIAAQVRAVGGEPTVLGPAGDDPDVFAGLLAWAAEGSDLVVTTGGVSAGDHDVVKAALAGRDGMWFGSVAVKPGRPQGAGVVDAGGRAVPVVCLPGTPVAAYCSFLLFAVPAIRTLAGHPPRRSGLETSAPLAEALAADPERTLLLPGAMDEAGRVAVLPGHAGHSQRLLAAADVIMVVPSSEPLAAGQWVDVIRLSPEV